MIDNKYQSYLVHYGSSQLDVFIINKLKTLYDCHFIVNYNGKRSLHDMVVWRYCYNQSKLVDEELFVKLMTECIQTNKKFICANISIKEKGSHRNILVIDNKCKRIHYYDPNEMDNITVYDKFREQNIKIESRRKYFTNIVTCINSQYYIEKPICNHYYTCYYLELDEKLGDIICNNGICTGLTYNYIYTIVSGQEFGNGNIMILNMINILKLCTDDNKIKALEYQLKTNYVVHEEASDFLGKIIKMKFLN